MTVSELIEQLSQQDPARLVVCQRDSEGNSYSPLYDMWADAYTATTTWYGEAGHESLTDEDRENGYSDEDIITDGVPALFLCPVN